MIAAAREKLGTDCFVGYGLSETTPVLTLGVVKDTLLDRPEEEQYARQAMTGIPIVGVELRIVDTDGHDVAADGEGDGRDHRRAADHVMKGYHNLPEDTAGVIVGRLVPHRRPGDDGRRRLRADQGPDEGHHHQRGREYLLGRDRGCALPAPGGTGSRRGRRARRAVGRGARRRWWCSSPATRPPPRRSWPSAPSGCPGFKRPKLIEIAPEFAKTGTGKIIKTELREKYWAGLGVAGALIRKENQRSAVRNQLL